MRRWAAAPELKRLKLVIAGTCGGNVDFGIGGIDWRRTLARVCCDRDFKNRSDVDWSWCSMVCGRSRSISDRPVIGAREERLSVMSLAEKNFGVKIVNGRSCDGNVGWGRGLELVIAGTCKSTTEEEGEGSRLAD